MTVIATLKKIKAVHDYREQVATAKLQQSKAALARYHEVLSGIDQQANAVDESLHAELHQLLATTRDRDHYTSFTSNVSVRRVAHREARMWLGHQKSKVQEDIKLAVEELKRNQQQLSIASRKQEKMRTLIVEESREAEIRLDLKEEDDLADFQVSATGDDDAG